MQEGEYPEDRGCNDPLTLRAEGNRKEDLGGRLFRNGVNLCEHLQACHLPARQRGFEYSNQAVQYSHCASEAAT